MKAREKGYFASLKDFYVRTSLNSESLQELIVAGAFDGIAGSRRQVLWELGILDTYSRGGMDLADAEGVPLDEMTRSDKLAAEYRVHGFSANGHVLDRYRERLMEEGVVKSTALEGRRPGTGVCVAGLTVCLQMPPTAKGFAFLTLEDEAGLINIVLRPNVYETYRQIVRLEPMIVVEGTVEKKEVFSTSRQRIL